MRDERKFGSGRPPSIANTVEKRRARGCRTTRDGAQRLRQQPLVAAASLPQPRIHDQQAARGSRSSSGATPPAIRSSSCSSFCGRRDRDRRVLGRCSAAIRSPRPGRRECLRCAAADRPRRPRSLLRRLPAARQPGAQRPATLRVADSASSAASAFDQQFGFRRRASARGVHGMRHLQCANGV